MSELIDMVDRISGKYQSRLDRLIDPLSTMFGATAFAYYQIDTQGGMTYLGNHPEISEYYFDRELYKGNPFLKHPDLVQPGFVLTEAETADSFQQSQEIIEEQFGLNKLLLIFEREGDVLHAYGIGTTLNRPNLTNIYLNNLEKLRGYCNYFRKETGDLQKILRGIKIDMAALIGDDFFRETNHHDVRLERDKERKFMEQLRIFSPQQVNLKPLSLREIECLRGIVQGKSSRMIADELLLSQRTVEHYLENIKDKLGCFTKRELFAFAEKLLSLGFELSILGKP